MISGLLRINDATSLFMKIDFGVRY